jgi:hypothetical protein
MIPCTRHTGSSEKHFSFTVCNPNSNTVIGNGALVDMQATQTTGIKISGSYVTLSNFEATRPKDAGIAIPGKYVTVRNNVLHDNVAENGIGACGIDNDISRIDRVLLGALASLDAGTLGTYFFDAFDSRRGSYIGP